MESTLQKPKIALVHDFLLRLGGAERVLLALKEIFPRADIFTLFYDRDKMERYFNKSKVRTSFLDKLPLARRFYRGLAALLPTAVESFDLRDYDLVISSCNGFVKGLVLRPKTIHLCYCHSPVRYLWDYTHQYQSGFSFFKNIIFHYLRLWDRSAANRVDYFIANSKTTSQRIRKYYGQEAKVIYPPVGGNFLFGAYPTYFQQNNFFLIVSQLTPHKRIDLAIDAFNKLNLPLVVIGQGRDRRRLEKMAQGNIKFLGWQTDEVVRQYLQNCRAFIFPGEDDFGIAPVEAMSFGKPVLAYRRGGATETVLEGITGEFFDEPASESLADGLRRLIMNFSQYSPLVIKKRAEKFSSERFKKEISEFIEKIVSKEKNVLE